MSMIRQRLEAISKTRLKPDGRVAGRLKMLIRQRTLADSSFSLPRALLNALIYKIKM